MGLAVASDVVSAAR